MQREIPSFSLTYTKFIWVHVVLFNIVYSMHDMYPEISDNCRFVFVMIKIRGLHRTGNQCLYKREVYIFISGPRIYSFFCSNVGDVGISRSVIFVCVKLSPFALSSSLSLSPSRFGFILHHILLPEQNEQAGAATLYRKSTLNVIILECHTQCRRISSHSLTAYENHVVCVMLNDPKSQM